MAGSQIVSQSSESPNPGGHVQKNYEYDDRSDIPKSDVAPLGELEAFDPEAGQGAFNLRLEPEVLLSLVRLVVGEDRQLSASVVADSIQAEINHLRSSPCSDPWLQGVDQHTP